MLKRIFKNGLLVLINIIFLLATGHAQTERSEEHILVSMRMIGHKILLNSGDSSSPVLPIKKEGNHYKIQFKSAFQFKPQELVSTISSVVDKNNVANKYVVEVEKSETGEVIYSYEMGDTKKADLIPCLTRMPPKDYYNIVITILDPASMLTATGSPLSRMPDILFIIGSIIMAVVGITWYIFFHKKKLKSKEDPNVITIGQYQFDPVNSDLLCQDQRVPLSAKESELLLLLYNAANTTVEREVILKNVWGDEGDYIGRTLDVFISKLRKKLEVDKSLKIVNIRGIGYKLLLNVQE